FEHHGTVPVVERVAAIAVLHRQPLVIFGRTKCPLDDAGAGGGGGALDDGVFAALDAVDLVKAAVSGDKFPLQVLAAVRGCPLGDLRSIGQGTLVVKDQHAGPILDLINAGGIDGGTVQKRRLGFIIIVGYASLVDNIVPAARERTEIGVKADRPAVQL